jgi:hypothetical protein
MMRQQSVPNETHGKKQSEYAETQPPRNDWKEQRGGPQTDQRSGETEQGARNQEVKGKNPQSDNPGS